MSCGAGKTASPFTSNTHLCSNKDTPGIGREEKGHSWNREGGRRKDTAGIGMEEKGHSWNREGEVLSHTPLRHWSTFKKWKTS